MKKKLKILLCSQEFHTGCNIQTSKLQWRLTGLRPRTNMCYASEERKKEAGRKDSESDHATRNNKKCIKLLAPDSSFRDSIGGSCIATKNEHEQVERAM